MLYGGLHGPRLVLEPLFTARRGPGEFFSESESRSAQKSCNFLAESLSEAFTNGQRELDGRSGAARFPLFARQSARPYTFPFRLASASPNPPFSSLALHVMFVEIT